MDISPITVEATRRLDALVAEAKRIEEDSIYSAKSHFEAARSWESRHLWIGVPATILAAISGVSALSAYAQLAGVLALLVAALTALFTFLNPRERAASHLKAGNAYKGLNNDARIFHQILCSSGQSPDDLSARLLTMNQQRNSLNSESPIIPRRAFEAARRGIESGEARHVVDERRRSAKR